MLMTKKCLLGSASLGVPQKAFDPDVSQKNSIALDAIVASSSLSICPKSCHRDLVIVDGNGSS